MKKLSLLLIILFSSILSIYGCSKESDNIIYAIDNTFFSKPALEKGVLTTVGVNGNNYNSKSYQIKITAKNRISILNYEAIIYCYSEDNQLIHSFKSSSEREYAANSEIIFSERVEKTIYDRIYNVHIDWQAKTMSNPDIVSFKATNPITHIDVNTDNTTMIVGESIVLDFDVYPNDTDENVKIINHDDSIIELKGLAIIAKKVGKTWIKIRKNGDESNFIGKEILINVIDPIYDFDFQSTYYNALKKSVVNVTCVAYNTSSKKYTTKGKGVIINCENENDLYYFITDKSIFDNTSLYKYGEWYLTDYLGKKYPIIKLYSHQKTELVMGAFTSTTNYYLTKLNSSSVFAGDYIYYLSSDTSSDRIISEDYYDFNSKYTLPSNVFYHATYPSNRIKGEPVYNINGELVGIDYSFSDGIAMAISSTELNSFYNAMFKESNRGDAIDIF